MENPKSVNVPEGSRLDELSEQIFALTKEYWQEYQKTIGSNAVVWVKNDETGEFFCYTRGEYSGDLIKYIGEIR